VDEAARATRDRKILVRGVKMSEYHQLVFMLFFGISIGVNIVMIVIMFTEFAKPK